MRHAVALLVFASVASADGEVDRTLLARDVGEWARELEAQPLPRDAADLLVRFDVLLRAGHLDRLPEVIDALASANASDDAIHALTMHGCIDLARRALDRFPNVDRTTVEHFVEACGDGIDEEWLAARAAANDSFFEPWFCLRVRRGTAGSLLEKLAEGVRGQPTDLKTVHRYLSARHYARATDDPSWIADVVRLRLASESAEIAGWFMSEHPEVAVFFLERSLAQPFTVEDDRRLKLMLAAPPWDRWSPASATPRRRT